MKIPLNDNLSDYNTLTVLSKVVNHVDKKVKNIGNWSFLTEDLRGLSLDPFLNGFFIFYLFIFVFLCV